MAVTISAVGSSVTLSKYLKIWCLSLNLNHGYCYKIYRILLLLLTIFLCYAGVYYKLENCAFSTVILRYVDLFLYQIRFSLNMIDLAFPLYAGSHLLQLTEFLDATETSHKKTILCHTILNYCFIICQFMLQVIASCYRNKYCSFFCLFPYLTSYALMTSGFYRCSCVLVLLKKRAIEISQDLFRKLEKVDIVESLVVNIRQVDELLEAVYAFGRCFGIQLALQLVNFEGMVVYNVVMVKKVPAGVPLLVDMLVVETMLLSGVSYEIIVCVTISLKCSL